jgi:hypothetical protein
MSLIEKQPVTEGYKEKPVVLVGDALEGGPCEDEDEDAHQRVEDPPSQRMPKR